ncbi:MAG: BREX-1 system adenine-specific DNA-methyltransferase PglX, partial [Actinomyces sp.]
METAPLKSFATWARTELIAQVSARIAAALAPGSPERTENPSVLRALEADIKKPGGDATGKDAVADKVAYTWFNRIIALRFMDANGYTNAGVVSPSVGQTVGQPEILADAKRGTFDPDVVNATTAAIVMGLLDGTRPSADPQGEAYTLLLAAYCRYWNRSMPFMFEREGDYTEFLIPANLLADGSILARAVVTMTPEVCRDVEVIGWLYQFYISERKDEVFAGFKRNHKAGADEIPAATQLFTPHWIVRYLVENSVGRLWMLNHPESHLVDQMDYYIAPVDEETDFLRLSGPEELAVIDPACGSGHMLTYAFDLLYAIYEEEGYSPSEIPSLILTHNLYGTEIDPRAGALAAFALTMKARGKQRAFFGKHVEPSICVIEPISFSPDELDFLMGGESGSHCEEVFWRQFEHADTLGSLIQPDPELTVSLAEGMATFDGDGDLFGADTVKRARRVVDQAKYLTRRYAVAVANPPYMGSKQMNALLSQFMKDEYPDGKSDLFAGFIERCTNLAGPRGTVAMITMQSWM